MVRLLIERESIGMEKAHWVLNEAKNAIKLQNGGTFKRVLSRRIDEVIIPIFAEIISTIDRNCNLSLLNPSDQSGVLSQFWLAIFKEPSLMQFKYEDMVTGKKHRQAVNRTFENDFHCKLPFSWLIKQAVDSQWEAACSVGMYKMIELTFSEMQLYCYSRS